MFNNEQLDREEHYNYHSNQSNHPTDQYNSNLIDGIVIHHGESQFVDKKQYSQFGAN